jgi:hypothetical protein
MKIRWSFVFDVASTWIFMCILSTFIGMMLLPLLYEGMIDSKQLFVICLIVSFMIYTFLIPAMIMEFPWLLRKQREIDKENGK